MAQEATIKSLILSAAEGASEGVSVLQSNNIPVELDEFEMEVTYAAETELTKKTDGQFSSGVNFRFVTAKAKIGHTRTSRSKATYGLKVRFLFSGKEVEEEEAVQ
ncbi:hypothetical protein R9C00_17175 [Flammeovirgaceae bacterium SG7u.111]|nr:hypothetical protein [Flammeovirgaceae bacterium SG7u.132]WPO33434.1 hypothetical protein R9C00_17175 [Flammeovirgaceae bacterium SG7u.111]